VVGRRWENFGAEKRWKKKKHADKEDGIFVHPQNVFNGLILNWCIGGCWFTPAYAHEAEMSVESHVLAQFSTNAGVECIPWINL
jgi:hypothetical protein